MKTDIVETSHGRIAVRDTGGQTPVVVLIHGNSSSGGVFRHLMSDDIAARYRMVALDLPGHGDSGDALDPARTYNMPGYAEALSEALRQIGIDKAIVFGWSLGGHIALEMISRFPGMQGLMITGSPPVAPGELGVGFKPSPHMALAGQEHFSEQDVQDYASSTCGEPVEPFLVEGVRRTDGRARRLMIEAFANGVGANQRALATKAKIPLAVVNGADEPFVNLEFVRGLTYDNLWRGACVEIAGSGHAPFWDAPEKFKPIFLSFLDDVTSGRVSVKA